jgi:transposase
MSVGRKPRLNEETLQKIAERIKEQPDIALRELIDEYSLPISIPGLCKIINKKLGWRRKKKRHMRRNNTVPTWPNSEASGKRIRVISTRPV